MKIIANEQFKHWAQSHSGYDGGNPNGSVWFCGIEYGGGTKIDSLSFDIVIDPPSVLDHERHVFIKEQYNWKLAKLYSSIIGHDPKDYKNTYKSTNAFSSSADTFKLNLYPIAFKNTDEDNWESWLFEKTGFPTKALYLSWCQQSRFPHIKAFAEKQNPQVIICTGSSYRTHFLMAFSGLHNAFNKLESKLLGDKLIYWTSINNGKTLLFIIPFLGQGGLKSDSDIKMFGDEITLIKNLHFR